MVLAAKLFFNTNVLDPSRPGSLVVYGFIVLAFAVGTFRFSSAAERLAGAQFLGVKERGEFAKTETELSYFGSLCSGLGLIGTVWGLILMGSAFSNYRAGENGAELVTGIGSGMGVALYTTLAGQIAAQMLGFQGFLLERIFQNHEISQI